MITHLSAFRLEREEVDRTMDDSTSISARQPSTKQNGSYRSPQRKRHAVMSRKLASNHAPATPPVRGVSVGVIPTRNKQSLPEPLSVRRAVKRYRKSASAFQRGGPDEGFQLRDMLRPPARMSAIKWALFVDEEKSSAPIISRPPLASRRCARKSKPITLTLAELSSDDSDPESESAVSDDRAASPLNVDEDEIQIISNPNVPSHELVKALQHLRPVSRLPFLRRNLRKGFHLACQKTGIKTDMPSESLAPEVDILIRIQTSEPNISHSTQMRGWCCPFCRQHDAFKTQQMLLIHLKWDHREFEVECHQVFNFFDAPTDRLHWKLQLTLSRPNVTPTSANHINNDASVIGCTDSVLADGRIPAEINLDLPVSEALVEDETMREESTASDPQDWHEITRLPDASVHPGPVDEGIHDAVEESSVEQSLVDRGAHTGDADIIAQVEAGVSSLRIHSPVESDLPPVLKAPHEYDFMLPAIRYPYLPFRSYDGGKDIHYSCRPGGPRIYDLLGALSMEKFGVLAWEVLDREEEIFEHDNYRDELKVMQALWARWIKLNRNVFHQGNLDGVEAFVDEYWRMMYYAAGCAAFRIWLLMMLAGGYISGIDVAKILHYYKGKVEAHLREAERKELDN